MPSSPGSPTLNLTPVPSPKRDDLPSSPTLNLTPVPFTQPPAPSPQPPALLRAPTLDLTTPSPLPEDPGCEGEEEEKSKEEEKSNVDRDVVSDVEEEEKSKEGRSLDKSIKALKDFARGITNTFSKLPEDKCSLCERGKEDFKYYPIISTDRVSALEALALKMLEWKKPGEALKQREYEEGFDSLAEERHEAMKYHGLDVECEDEESD